MRVYIFRRMVLKDWMTVKQAAKALRRSNKWVYCLIADKRLVAEKLGREFLVSRESVKAFEHQPRGPVPAKRSKDASRKKAQPRIGRK